jgi:hypothetical protein
MKQLLYLFLNSLTLLFALTMNYLSGTGAINGMTVGEVSAKFENLFTPAGYAFAIWGVIYLLLIAFVAYQWYAWFKHKQDEALTQTGFWFAVSNVANGLWIYAWTHLQLEFSILLMLVLLFSLIIMTLRLRLEIWDAPLRIIFFVWWPVCIYLGWIVVATVANFSAWLVSIGWRGGSIPETYWALLMIAVATSIYAFLIYYRNLREAALVGVWALIAIAVKQWEMERDVVYGALAGALILFIYSMWHGYKNRLTSPAKKLERGEF